MKGHGVPQSLKEAAKWLQDAFNQGGYQALKTSVSCLRMEMECFRATKKTAKWYQRALDQGGADAIRHLAALKLKQDRSKSECAASNTTDSLFRCG